jgi:hypothetical protein
MRGSVVDPDRVGSASFCRVRTGIVIQGMPIRIRTIRIGINSHANTYIFFFLQENFKMLAEMLKS